MLAVVVCLLGVLATEGSQTANHGSVEWHRFKGPLVTEKGIVVGNAILVSLRFGMTPEQVVQVFGCPDSIWGGSEGALGGSNFTFDQWSYLRYGVRVTITRSPESGLSR
jgi:hypothetical protein